MSECSGIGCQHPSCIAKRQAIGYHDDYLNVNTTSDATPSKPTTIKIEGTSASNNPDMGPRLNRAERRAMKRNKNKVRLHPKRGHVGYSK